MLVTVVVLEAFFTPLILVAFGDEFAGAVDIGRILIFAWAFLGLRRLLIAVAMGTSATGRHWVSVLEVIGMLAMFGAVLLGMSLSGSTGAAAGLTVVAASSCLALLLVIKRVFSDAALDAKVEPPCRAILFRDAIPPIGRRGDRQAQ